MDRINIHQLKTETLIGVYPEERNNPQTLLWDIELEIDSNPGKQSDNLQDTLDYASVCRAIIDFAKQTRYQLLETLAEKTADLLLFKFKLVRCKITIHKKPFDLPEVERVAFSIER